MAASPIRLQNMIHRPAIVNGTHWCSYVMGISRGCILITTKNKQIRDQQSFGKKMDASNDKAIK
ncbi:hypothetical protein KO02_00545 [Sphingobacterium sp. ML3W]|nr:hypothetical protein KO02_00545 [Sphingobacterium sp. ML3W]